MNTQDQPSNAPEARLAAPVELSLTESELIGGAAARVNPVSYTFTAGRCTITSTGVEDWNKMQSIPTGTTISCHP